MNKKRGKIKKEEIGAPRWVSGGQIVNIEPPLGISYVIARGAAIRLRKRLSTLKSDIYLWLGQMSKRKKRRLFVYEVRAAMSGLIATALTEETIALTGDAVVVSGPKFTERDSEELKQQLREQVLSVIHSFCRKNRIRNSVKNGWGL